MILPPGATQERTQKILDQVSQYYREKEKPNVQNVVTVNGFGFAGRGQNMGIAFVGLKPWDERRGPENSVDGIVSRATQAFSSLPDALIVPFNLPPIIALGNANGFDFQLLDRGGLGHEKTD